MQVPCLNFKRNVLFLGTTYYKNSTLLCYVLLPPKNPNNNKKQKNPTIQNKTKNNPTQTNKQTNLPQTNKQNKNNKKLALPGMSYDLPQRRYLIHVCIVRKELHWQISLPIVTSAGHGVYLTLATVAQYVSKFTVIGSFCVLFVYFMEVFPTTLRWTKAPEPHNIMLLEWLYLSCLWQSPYEHAMQARAHTRTRTLAYTRAQVFTLLG